MTVSEFLSADIPAFVLGCFLSRTIVKNNKIYTEVSFKSSKYVPDFDLSAYKNIYLDKLNQVSAPYSNWILHSNSGKSFIANFSLENDLELTFDRFFYKLYYKIVNSSWVSLNIKEGKNNFVRGFMESRGSIDTKRNYISQDYFYNNDLEYKKYRVLTDFCDVPYYVLNINFRDLQEQYYQNVNKRNTQFRIHSSWFMKNIGMLNDYKIKIFSVSHANDSLMIHDGINYYRTLFPFLQRMQERLLHMSLSSKISGDLTQIRTIGFCE